MKTDPLSVTDILKDNRSGSQEITRKAAILVRQLMEEGNQGSVDAVKNMILELGLTLIRAQPAMASLFNLFNRIFLHLDAAKEKNLSKNTVCRALRDFIQEMHQQNALAAPSLVNILGQQSLVLTHSSSGAVKEALRQCWEMGKRFSILCTESRPACEGSLLAQEFCRLGIPATLVTDTLAYSFFKTPSVGDKKVNLVLVGADAVSIRGIINKAGTLGLAMAAMQCAVPFYAIAGTQKFFPSSYPTEKSFQNKPRDEILSSAPKSLNIVNRYFDLTPLDHLSGVLTEKGILDPRDIPGHIRNVSVHSQWMAMVSRELEVL